VTVFLSFCGAIGGSTLITLVIPCINGATEVAQYLHGYGHPVFLVVLYTSTLGIKTLAQAYTLVRINLHAVGQLLSFFNTFG
jgi:hypothetical protein